MEDQKDMLSMLELMLQPAFFVRDGMITLVNQAAQQFLLESGTPIEPLLGSSLEEYDHFSEGCLYLSLQCNGCYLPASVTHIGDANLFILEPKSDQTELKAMALTAMNFRQPLSEIMTISMQLREEASHQLSDAKLAKMNRRLNQLHRMVCNMTDAIHYSEDTLPRMSYQNICSVLDEIFQRAAALAEQAGFRLTYQGLDQVIDCVICPERLERAVYNIISNTMKFSPAGTVMGARLQHRGNKLYLSIQDNGPGIPSHQLGNIYSRYRRYPGLESDPNGLGLGMVLVRGAASCHGGAVLIDHPKGQGTRVTLSLTINRKPPADLRSNTLAFDYAGELDHALLELSDVLPEELF